MFSNYRRVAKTAQSQNGATQNGARAKTTQTLKALLYFAARCRVVPRVFFASAAPRGAARHPPKYSIDWRHLLNETRI